MPEIFVFNEVFNEDEPAAPAARTLEQEAHQSIDAKLSVAPKERQLEYGNTMNAARANYDSLVNTLLGFDGERGLLEVYGEDIAPLSDRVRRQQRESEFTDLAELGPKYFEALRTANPEQSAMRDKLYAMAMGELENPGMTDDEATAFTQSYRGASQGRLVDTGEAGAAAEAYFLTDRQRERRRDSQQFASSIIAQDQRLYGDPSLAILGRSTGASPITGDIINPGMGTSQRGVQDDFDPFNGYASDLFNTNYNAGWADVFNTRNNNAARTAAFMSLMGSVMGSGSGAAAGAM
jgi:hypothetical protein